MTKKVSYNPGSFTTGKIVGFEEVMKNLNQAISDIKVNSARGMVLAIAHIRRKTESTPPLTPVDKGNLRASWFTSITKIRSVQMPVLQGEKGGIIKEGYFKGKRADELRSDHSETKAETQGIVNSAKNKLMAFFGYTTFYAAAVHEKLGANFKRPGAGPKWFEQAIYSDIDIIRKIIKENATIKK